MITWEKPESGSSWTSSYYYCMWWWPECGEPALAAAASIMLSVWCLIACWTAAIFSFESWVERAPGEPTLSTKPRELRKPYLLIWRADADPSCYLFMAFSWWRSERADCGSKGCTFEFDDVFSCGLNWVLRLVVACCKGCLRLGDVLVPYGGCYFLLPEESTD